MAGGNRQFTKKIKVAMRCHRNTTILMQGQRLRLEIISLVSLLGQVASEGAIDNILATM